MATPFITDAEATQKIQQSYSQLESQIVGIASGFQGTIEIADTPTDEGYYKPIEEGTYPNSGGLDYLPSTTDEGFDVTFIFSGGVWVKKRIDKRIVISQKIDANNETEAVSGKAIAEELKPLYTVNLFDKSKAESGRFNPDGTKYTTSNWIRVKISAKPNEQYTISGKQNGMGETMAEVVFMNDNILISYIPANGPGDLSDVTFTTPPNTTDILVNIAGILNVGLNPTDNIYVNNYQIQEGATATNYEPYGLKTYDSKIASIDTEIEEIQSSLIVNINDIFDPSIFTINEFMRVDGSVSANSSYRRSEKISLEGIYSLELTGAMGSLSVSPAVFFDENDVHITGITASVVTLDTISVEVPDNAATVVFSTLFTGVEMFKADGTVSIEKSLSINSRSNAKLDRVFVATNGDDGNLGVEDYPVKTINKAISLVSNSGEVILKEGDYYDDFFDLSGAAIIKTEKASRVRLIYGVRFDSATLESGYSKVYKVNHVGTIAPTSFLWQHDINDEETLISEADRYPQHRGKKYRLSSKRIYPATSIAEIEAEPNKLMWFKSGNDLYFSKEAGSDLTLNPIVIPKTQLTASKERNVFIKGLDIMYANILTTNLNGEFIDCSVGHVNTTGAFRYDNTCGIAFTRCRAYACNNDGFNGHSVSPINKYAVVTSAIFNDCHTHDNSDDGESCHEYSEVFHNGGLHEFNGNGITPASGGHAWCQNTVVRRCGEHPWSVGEDGTAFSAQGAPIDNGESTDITCISCLSEFNGIGFRGLDNSSRFINCISKDDTISYGLGTQINCVTL